MGFSQSASRNPAPPVSRLRMLSPSADAISIQHSPQRRRWGASRVAHGANMLHTTKRVYWASFWPHLVEILMHAPQWVSAHGLTVHQIRPLALEQPLFRLCIRVFTFPGDHLGRFHYVSPCMFSALVPPQLTHGAPDTGFWRSLCAAMLSHFVARHRSVHYGSVSVTCSLCVRAQGYLCPQPNMRWALVLVYAIACNVVPSLAVGLSFIATPWVLGFFIPLCTPRRQVSGDRQSFPRFPSESCVPLFCRGGSHSTILFRVHTANTPASLRVVLHAFARSSDASHSLLSSVYLSGYGTHRPPRLDGSSPDRGKSRPGGGAWKRSCSAFAFIHTEICKPSRWFVDNSRRAHLPRLQVTTSH
ncbi:hypothetical protein C2E23DRAFT_215256 [Lenzites betulinus]|nr:hypothetical protein C2E23DRAFT_215256 [Lenzites betulinus]